MKPILNGVALLLFLTADLSFAGSQFFVCPGTYQTAKLGDTMEQVQQVCGKPADIKTYTQTDTQSLQLKQWVYVGQIRTTLRNPGASNYNYAPELRVTFKDGKVIQITTNNQSVANVFPCYSMQRIKIGNSKSDVLFQCGVPRYQNTITQAVPVTVHITQWTYDFGLYNPTRIFIFKEGKLTEINVGPLSQPKS